jgi:hypothetical protein
MEQHTFKNVNNILNTNIYSSLEKPGSQSSNLYLNVVHFFNTSVYWASVATQDSCFGALVCLIHVVLLSEASLGAICIICL